MIFKDDGKYFLIGDTSLIDNPGDSSNKFYISNWFAEIPQQFSFEKQKVISLN